MTHGSLFSGIGGFDLASEWMGWNNVFHCEIEPFPRKILNYYWPKAKSYEDIKTTDFTIHRGQIDVLTGGFPCQPYSHAGKRKGKEDDRHLWPEMLRAIREIQPVWIVGENVPGIISWNGGLVFEEVCADLEDEGYEVQPVILPAVSKDAPHRRDRVWFVAYSTNARLKGVQSGRENGAYGLNAASDTSFQRCDHRSDHREERQVQGFKVGSNPENKSEWNGWIDRFGENGSYEHTTDTRSQGLEGENRPRESIRFTPGAWDNFPTQPPICSGDDGLPSDSYRETISRKHKMDRDLVIKSALDAGRLEVDFDSGKIYSRTIKGMKGERVELKGADCNGYRVHNIYFEGFKKQCRAHQIVWIAANGLYDKSKLMIDHINRDKSDNRLSNLRLTTPKGNRMNAPDPKSRFSQNEKDLMHELHTIGHMSFREISEHFECSKSRVHQIVSEHNGIYGITFSKWRNESIKGYGNAVVPQVVYEIFKVIEKMQ